MPGKRTICAGELQARLAEGGAGIGEAARSDILLLDPAMPIELEAIGRASAARCVERGL